jgi:F-type H+-transporting ATPase subunit delta
MAEKTTIARPYAKAAFQQASGAGTLAAWSDALRTAAAVVQDGRVQELLGNPSVSTAELARLVIDLAGASLDEHGRNFVHALADNRRLSYLPEISALFEQFKDEAEGVIDVTVTTATPLESAQLAALAGALQQRLKRQVRLQSGTDPQLLGGAVVRAGDLVIDGSLRSRLERIAYELTA